MDGEWGLRRKSRDWIFVVFDIGPNIMDNHCTAKKMIIALWWWCSPTHNLYSGFGRQNSTLWRRFNSTLEKKLQISRFFLQKFSFSSWIRSRHFSFLFSKLEMWIPYFSFSSLDLTFLASRQCLISIKDIVKIFFMLLFFCSEKYFFF